MPLGLNKIFMFGLLFFGTSCYLSAHEKVLTLQEAERLALYNAPELQRLHSQAQALNEQGIAAGQLGDPKLFLGAINVPTDTFSFTQDDMTMLAVGIQQAFPPGRSLFYKAQQTKALANVENKKIAEQRINLLRSVRQAWLELYYWAHALPILQSNQELLKELLKVTESQYSANKINQTDVLQVQLELSRQEDQITQLQQQHDIAHAQLIRWIGLQEHTLALPNSISSWPEPPALKSLQSTLDKHPLLSVDAASIEAASYEVAWAKEQYKLGWMFDVSYGFRQGNMSDGNRRSDMLTADVNVDLPLFRGNRQDRQLKSSAYKLEATKYDRLIHYKDLLQELTMRYAAWQSLSKREHIYHQQLIPQAQQNSKIALLSYQNSQGDLITVLRAYSNENTINLEQLQIKIEQAKARAALLYFEGILE